MFLTQYPRAPPPAAPRARVRLCDSETREHGESDCPRDGLFRDAEDSLEADGNGYGAFAYAGRGFHRGRRLERALTFSTTAVDRRSDKTRQEPLPMLRCAGLPGFA